MTSRLKRLAMTGASMSVTVTAIAAAATLRIFPNSRPKAHPPCVCPNDFGRRPYGIAVTRLCGQTVEYDNEPLLRFPIGIQQRLVAMSKRIFQKEPLVKVNAMHVAVLGDRTPLVPV